MKREKQNNSQAIINEANMVKKTIRIDAVVQDEKFQVREKLDKRQLVKYARAYSTGSEFPPVCIVQIGDAYVLADGWHRIEALKLIGEIEVNALILENGTVKDAYRIASKGNMHNGLPLSKKDKKNVFNAYMLAGEWKNERGRPKGLRMIEKELEGWITAGTVRNWMKKDHRTIYRDYYQGGGNRAIGGMSERNGDDMFTVRTREALNQALAAYKGVNDLETRGELIKQAETMLEAMKKNGKWKEYVENPDF